MDKVFVSQKIPFGRQQVSGETDYVKDGALYKGAMASSVLVRTQADLANLPADYAPGTIAHTAGFKAMWEKGADGSWVSLM